MDWLNSTFGLRMILLAGGVLLIAVLVWLDRRRRQASGNALLSRAKHGSATEHDATAAAQRDEPMLAATRTDARDTSTHRPLPVIDWSALERDGGTAGEDESRMAVHTMSPDHAPTAADAAQHFEATRDVAATEVFIGSPTIDHWPAEEVRRICSLRIAPPAGERFAGRVLRQGLQGAGFAHGVLGIFHHADDEGRALISAANLARPGQLDPSIMDFQRFGGLHLFAVLPGPIPDAELLDLLFFVAAELAGRIGGVLQDERGGTLTALRRRELLYQYAGVLVPAETASVPTPGTSGAAPVAPPTA